MTRRLALLGVAVAAVVAVLLWLALSRGAPVRELPPAQAKAAAPARPAPAPGPQAAAPLLPPLNQPLPEVWTRFAYDPSIPLRREIGEFVRLHPPSEARPLGRATLAAAFESQWWAVAGGNLDYLEQAIVLEGRQAERMAQLLATAPATIRAECPTPERFAALLLAGASDGVRGYAVSRQLPVADDETILSVDTLKPGQDRSRGHAENFRKTAQGEWRRVITAKMVTEWELTFGKRAAASP